LEAEEAATLEAMAASSSPSKQLASGHLSSVARRDRDRVHTSGGGTSGGPPSLGEFVTPKSSNASHEGRHIVTINATPSTRHDLPAPAPAPPCLAEAPRLGSSFGQSAAPSPMDPLSQRLHEAQSAHRHGQASYPSVGMARGLSFDHVESQSRFGIPASTTTITADPSSQVYLVDDQGRCIRQRLMLYEQMILSRGLLTLIADTVCPYSFMLQPSLPEITAIHFARSLHCSRPLFL